MYTDGQKIIHTDYAAPELIRGFAWMGVIGGVVSIGVFIMLPLLVWHSASNFDLVDWIVSLTLALYMPIGTIWIDPWRKYYMDSDGIRVRSWRKRWRRDFRWDEITNVRIIQGDMTYYRDVTEVEEFISLNVGPVHRVPLNNAWGKYVARPNVICIPKTAEALQVIRRYKSIEGEQIT